MSDIWLRGVAQDRSIRNSQGGTYTGGPWKLVLHTTEGGWGGSMSVFRNGSAPHILAAPPSHPDGPRIVQFTPLNRSAAALQNRYGGAETNRDSAVQVEIVGYADRMRGASTRDLKWLGENVFRPILDALPIDPNHFPEFHDGQSGFTLARVDARQRFSARRWDDFDGICGHQHVPENEHWDPGALDVATCLKYAGKAGTDWAAIAAYLALLEDDDMIIYTCPGKPALLVTGGASFPITPAGGKHVTAGVKVVRLSAAEVSVYDRAERATRPWFKRILRTRIVD